MTPVRWILVLALACAPRAPSTAAIPPAPAAPAAPPAGPAAGPPRAPAMRLPRTLLPEANRVRLALDPTKETFRGRIEITARVVEPTRDVWLNAEDLTIDDATVVVGKERWPLQVFPQPHDLVGLRAPRALPAGTVTITLAYQGRIEPTETRGLFRQRDGDDWYAFTQLEALNARKVFPCFDEPDSKVPWQVTLEVPEGLQAFANTPVVSETKGAAGTKVVSFAQTQPLPSYLVAFAVGPFEVVQGPALKSGAPFRVVVPKGRKGGVAYVLESTPPLLALLEDYFGMPYPYEKLDLLAIPYTNAFSAMENPGLVTFNERLLLVRPQDFTIAYQRSYASVAAHELAHQWFGDLVTLAWWDDVWLNEAFATWMAEQVIERYRPDWNEGVGAVSRKNRGMNADSLQSARKIRQPVSKNDDVLNAFDGISYAKGAAVIRMFERWVGADAFRAGVRAYVRRHAHGNATAADFLAAVGEAAGRDVATPFSTFLDQVGTPHVTFERVCQPGQPPRLAMTQERYLPAGSGAERDQRWQIPICVKYPVGDKVASACTLLVEKQGELVLPDAGVCPAWILPNDGGIGYYRSAFGGDLLARLIDQGMKQLALPERVAVIGDVNALVTAGKADVGKALDLVARFAGEENRHLVSAVARVTVAVADLVPDELRPRYARFVRKVFGARARKLGWTPARNDDDDTRLLRSTLVGLVTDEGEDAVLGAQARRLALAWLGDRRAVDRDLIGLVIQTAALYGDADLFERYYQEARKADERRDRRQLLAALSLFRQPALVKRYLAIVASDEFDVREVMGGLRGGGSDPRSRRLFYEEVKARYEALAARIPEESLPSLAYVGAGLCDRALAPDVKAFFGEHTTKVPGGTRAYEQAMEQLDLCIAHREAHRAGLTAFLRRY